MIVQSFSFVVICCFFVGAQQKVVYVLPTTPAEPPETSPCPASECYSLKELSLWQNFTSNTSIVLLPGTHTIDWNETGLILKIENIRNVQITGLPTSANSRTVPKVECISGGIFQIILHNITGLTLHNFEIRGCSVNNEISSEEEKYSTDEDKLAANIRIADSCNITIERVLINHGSAVGLSMVQVYDRVSVLHSEFSHNGINCYLEVNEVYYSPTNHTGRYNTNITITDTGFKFREFLDEPLYIVIIASKHTFEVHLIDVTLHENQGDEGTNLYMYLNGDASSKCRVNIRGLISTNNKNCSNNFFGCGNKGLTIEANNNVHTHISDCLSLQSSISISAVSTYAKPFFYLKNMSFQDVTNTFDVLSFDGVGYGVIEDIQIITSTRPLGIGQAYNITIQGECLFKHNSDGIGIIGLYDKSTLTIGSNSLIQLESNTCSTQWTETECCSTFTVESSKIFISENSSLVFRNNTGTSSGVFSLTHSTVHILGKVRMLFDSNSGNNGGAIALYERSQISFCTREEFPLNKRQKRCHAHEMFEDNYASGRGGAVYIDDAGYINPITGVPEFQLYPIDYNVLYGSNVQLYFHNNTADIAGNALYGGWSVYHSPRIFNFNGQQKDLSTVASNPVRVCMCASFVPNCTVYEHTEKIYPGQTVDIKLIAVGQRFGTVPAIVHARILSAHNRSESTLTDGQYVQETHRNCTFLHYTLLSINKVDKLALTVEKRGVPKLQSLRDRPPLKDYDSIRELGILMRQFSLTVTFKDCPVGFSLNYTLQKCSCHPTFLEHQITDCDIETLKILKPSQKRINSTFTHTEGINITNGVIVHNHCPFDYCKQKTPHISLDMDHPDDQCDFNRSGILCGACETNFSHVFGTPRCKKCSNLWALLLLPAIALLGIALVVLLISLNLTVSGYRNDKRADILHQHCQS